VEPDEMNEQPDLTDPLLDGEPGSKKRGRPKKA